jgi:hypothetical protein
MGFLAQRKQGVSSRGGRLQEIEQDEQGNQHQPDKSRQKKNVHSTFMG